MRTGDRDGAFGSGVCQERDGGKVDGLPHGVIVGKVVSMARR